MKFRHENTVFLFEGQRRLFLWIHVLLVLEGLVTLVSLGTWWCDLSNAARERYYQRYIKIDKRL